MSPGFVFGLILMCALSNLAYGLPAILVYMGLVFKKRRLPNNYQKIFILLVMKVIWMISIHVTLGNKSFFSLLQALASDVIFLVMLFVALRRDFLVDLFRALILLFFVDFAFNVSIYLVGVDPLGRGAGMRADDILPRVGGIFGHPFYSVNIAIVALIAGIFLCKRWVVVLSALGVLMNGTLRAPLTLALVIFVVLLLRLRIKLPILVLFFILFASLVFGLTIYSAGSADYISGNYLRVLAWANAIKNIVNNPLLGTHTFLPGSFKDMSADVIVDYGIAESAYLQYALDFGVVPVVISICTFLLVVRSNLRIHYSSDGGSPFLAGAILSSIVFVDMFYGTFFGSVLTSFFYCALCISFDEVRMRSSASNS